MNQSQPTTQPKSYLKLLLIILGVVIVGGGLYYYFGIYRGIKGSSSISLASPTPGKSAAVSPSGTTKTSTPASEQTSTPQSSPSTSTATPPPPSGWKYDTWSVTAQDQHDIRAQYVVLIKNDWKKEGGGSASNHGWTGYGVDVTSGGSCGIQGNPCPLRIGISGGTPSGANQFATLDGKGYVTLTFNGLSDTDQKIILDSFKITQ